MKKLTVLLLCFVMLIMALPVSADADMQTIDRDDYSFLVPATWQEMTPFFFDGTNKLPRLMVMDIDIPASFEDLLALGDAYVDDYIVDVDSPEIIIPLHETEYSGNKALTISVFGNVDDGTAVVQADMFENPSGGFTYFAYYYNDDIRNYYAILDSLDFGDAAASEEEPAAAVSEEPTMGQQQALSEALSDLKYSAYSYDGLIEELTEWDGFTMEEAIYAADNCGADWNEQAVREAESDLKYSSYSRNGLIEELVEWDGFTQEQAEYAAAAVGY